MGSSSGKSLGGFVTSLLMNAITRMVRRTPVLWQDPRLRRRVLGSMSMLAGMGAGLTGYAFFREPLRVRLDHLTISLSNGCGCLPPQGLRILHLSDTHFRGENWREQAKIQSIRRACAHLEYDLLIHTGDFLHHDSGLPNVAALLDALPPPRLGAWAVFGNHDYSIYSHKEMLPRAWVKFNELSRANQEGQRRPTLYSHLRTAYQFGRYFANSPLDLKRIGQNDLPALETLLAARNIQTLHNRTVHLCRPDFGIDLYIAGVEDMTEGLPDVRRALHEIPAQAPTLLLSHNPDILLDPAIAQADLVLAGHTHGGQIVLPFVGAAHTQSNHLRRHEVSGYLRRGNTQVYITRGVGEGIPLRLGASPQITLITLLPGGDQP